MPQELNMDPFFSPIEALEIQAGYYGVPKAERRTEEILRAVERGDKKEAKSFYSLTDNKGRIEALRQRLFRFL